MYPKISIIIPIYNADKYLRNCLDSIINQTFTDWECLLIDDGSKDYSGIICEKYALKDSRFKVFHKANGGVSSARNIGLEHAKGKWVRFVDSDDKLNIESLYTLYHSVKNNDTDFCVGTFTNEKGEGTEIEDKIWHDKIELIRYLRNKVVFGIPWNKLFKKEIIDEHKLHFDESISSFEDELFVLNYLRFVNSTITVSSSVYLYCYYGTEHLSSKLMPIDLRIRTSKLIYDATLEMSKSSECREEAYDYYVKMIFMGVKWLYMFGVALPYFKRQKYLYKLLNYVRMTKINKRFEVLMNKEFGFCSYNSVFLDFRILITLKKRSIKRRFPFL